MPPQPPALPDDLEMREIVDLLAEVVAGMSGRLDRQGERIDHLVQLVAETREAAVAAKAYTYPERYGQFVGKEFSLSLDPVLDHFAGCTVSLRRNLDETAVRLKQLEAEERGAAAAPRGAGGGGELAEPAALVWIGALGAGAVAGLVVRFLAVL